MLALATRDLGRGRREVGAVERGALADVEVELLALEREQKVEELGRRLRATSISSRRSVSRSAVSASSPSTPSKTPVSVGESGASGGSKPSSSIALRRALACACS